MSFFKKISTPMIIAVALVGTGLIVAQRNCGLRSIAQEPIPPAAAAQAETNNVVEATVTGQNFCPACTLKKEEGAGAQCAEYGHTHALRVSTVVVDGEERAEMLGWVLHYLATDKSRELIREHEGETLVVTGKIYLNERVLEVASFTPAPETAEVREITWHRSHADALAEAQQRNTPILVDAYADWCGWCKRLEAETLSDPKVQERLRDFTLLKIDTDKHPDLARQYGVTGLPTTLVLDTQGKVILKRPGFMQPTAYLAMLADVKTP